ncbi:MAG TPA: cell division protein FtsL [Myxococcaceae bacterium]|nr:cell division protein FtsL [Myxococcaceae bacterium]
MSRRSGKGRRASLGAVLGQMLPVVLCFGLLGAVGILHVASRSQVVDAAYRLSSLEAESRTLALANDRLKLELATLKRPARLEAIARGQLGMRPPDASAVDSVAARPPPAANHAAEGRRTLADRRSPR